MNSDTSLTDEELLAIAKAATPGAWHRNISPATRYPTFWAGRNTHVGYVVRSGLPPEEIEANLDFITTFNPAYVTSLIGRARTAEEALKAMSAKSDMLADSNYLAGVTAGWNAAQDPNPNEALADLQRSRQGHVGAYRKALERLGSMEAFEGARSIDPVRDAELLARVEYARAVLSASPPAAPSLPADLLAKVSALAEEAREEIDAHNEWLIEHPDEPDPDIDWISAHPNFFIKLEAALAPFADRVAGIDTIETPAPPAAVAEQTVTHDWRVGDLAERLQDHPLVKAGEVHSVIDVFRGGYLGFKRPIGGGWNPRGWKRVTVAEQTDGEASSCNVCNGSGLISYGNGQYEDCAYCIGGDA